MVDESEAELSSAVQEDERQKEILQGMTDQRRELESVFADHLRLLKEHHSEIDAISVGTPIFSAHKS